MKSNPNFRVVEKNGRFYPQRRINLLLFYYWKGVAVGYKKGILGSVSTKSTFAYAHAAQAIRYYIDSIKSREIKIHEFYE